MDKNNKKVELEIYKVFNNRSIEGIKEFYNFSKIILIILSAIFGLSHYGKIVTSTSNSLSLIGLFIAIIWFLGTISQIKWKRWWEARTDRVENIVFKGHRELIELNKENFHDEPKIHFTFAFGLLPMLFIIVFVLDLIHLIIKNNNDFIFGAIFGILICFLFFLLYRTSYLYKPEGIKKKYV